MYMFDCITLAWIIELGIIKDVHLVFYLTVSKLITGEA